MTFRRILATIAVAILLGLILGGLIWCHIVDRLSRETDAWTRATADKSWVQYGGERW